MSRVDFYWLSQPSSQARLLFACRLLEKVYQQEQAVYVHLEQAEAARFFNQLLWTYRDDSFLPHHLAEEQPALRSPILLGYSEKPQTDAEVLLNLSEAIPVFHGHFKRILEIQPPENSRAFYETQGYTLHSHQIR